MVITLTLVRKFTATNAGVTISSTRVANWVEPLVLVLFSLLRNSISNFSLNSVSWIMYQPLSFVCSLPFLIASAWFLRNNDFLSVGWL